MSIVQEEHLEIPCGPLRLEGALARPPVGLLRGGAVICHPHPGFGGTMDNNVVLALRDAFLRQDWATLRFNFRGTGSSEGRQSGGIEEPSDVLAAFDAMKREMPGDLPLAMVGYSFGAYVGFRALSLSPVAVLAIGISPPVSMYEFAFLSTIEGLRAVSFIAGEQDSFCDPDLLRKSACKMGPPGDVTIEPGVDHFWFGAENRLDRFLSDWIASHQG